ARRFPRPTRSRATRPSPARTGSPARRRSRREPPRRSAGAAGSPGPAAASCRWPSRTPRSGPRPGRARLRPPRHGLKGIRLAREDLSVLGEPHDAERLVDGRRQVAEGEQALLVHDLLEDLDQDRDADRVDDAGLLEIEDQGPGAGVELRVRLARDLLPALIVD